MRNFKELREATVCPYNYPGLQNIFLCPEPRILETFRALWKIIKLYHSFPPSLGFQWCLRFIFPYEWAQIHTQQISLLGFCAHWSWFVPCTVRISLWAQRRIIKKVQSGDLWSLESVRARDRRSQRSRSSASLVLKALLWPLIFYCICPPYSLFPDTNIEQKNMNLRIH